MDGGYEMRGIEDDLLTAAKSGGANFMASLLRSKTAEPLVQAGQTQAAEAVGAKSVAWLVENWKTVAMYAVGGLAIFGGGIYWIARRKNKEH